MTITNSPDSVRAGSATQTELDLRHVEDFYRAIGWDNLAQADFFFETASLYKLSLEELKILYLLQLTEEQKMSDPLAILCQLDSEGRLTWETWQQTFQTGATPESDK